MSTKIEDYVCNLIAGNNSISSFYFAIDRARDYVTPDNRMKQFNYKVSFPGIGTNVYRSDKLLEFENLSYCLSYNDIFSQIDDKPTLEQYIILLLKGRNTIRGLYQECCRAKSLREYGKVFSYTFVNPFGIYAGVDKNRLTFNGALNFINFFCVCEKNVFDPILVFGGALALN